MNDRVDLVQSFRRLAVVGSLGMSARDHEILRNWADHRAARPATRGENGVAIVALGVFLMLVAWQWWSWSAH